MRNITTPTLLDPWNVWVCYCRYLAWCLFLLQYHTLTISVHELDFECNLLKIVTTYLKKMDLHPALVFLFFYSLLSLVPPQGQLCVSAALLLQCSILPNEAAPCCLTLWISPARLHLWMTDVLFYILLRLSLSHTPTNVTAYALQVRSLPFTCLPLFNLFFLCLAGKQQLGTFAYCFRYIFDKDDWIPKPIEFPVFVLNARVETTYTVAEAEEGSEELLPILQRE